MKKEEIAKILENFTSGKGGEWDWDDFISVPLKDPELDKIRKRCADLDKEFPPSKSGQYCNEDGIEVFQGYIKQLKNS